MFVCFLDIFVYNFHGLFVCPLGIFLKINGLAKSAPRRCGGIVFDFSALYVLDVF